MYAKTARKIAEKVNELKNANQYAEITKIIKTNVDKGHFECNYYDKIFPEVKKILEDEGYTLIETFNQHDGYITKISW